MLKKDILELEHKLMLVPISKGYRLNDFEAEYSEYTEFLREYALDLESKNISKTHILINKENANIIGYITLLAGSISLSDKEKEKHEVPLFSSFPCLKIGKLCADKKYNELYKGIGKLLIELSIGFATEMNKSGIASRFIIVDADIDNNPTITDFYKKNGFHENERIKKNGKTVSMRLDIFTDLPN